MLTDLDYDLLSAYIDGALTDSERADLESRLQTEPELRAELGELRATVTLLNNLPPRKAPRDFTLDARYARRTSFFASATFSALSTAAAIILFAVGAFLFTNNNAQQPTSSSEQSAQVAVVMTATSATTLDKAADATETLAANANDVAPVTAPTILEQEAQATEAVMDGLIMQATATGESTTGSLFQPDIEEPADAQDSGDTFNAAPASPSQSQGRSTEATETLESDLFSVQPQPTGVMGGAIQPPASEAGDAASSMMMVATETPTDEVLNFAAPLPAATFAPSTTQLPTATLAPSATRTPPPPLTLTHTPTSIPTLAPTAVPPVERERTSTVSLLPTLLLMLGGIFLVLAVATTIVRRRNRV